MSQMDQFESVFRAAIKDVFVYKPIDFKKVLIVTDLLGKDVDLFVEKIKHFTQVLVADKDIQWQVLTANDFQSTEDLLAITKTDNYDLICTYRNLQSNAWQFPHSLGAHLDVLLQLSAVPVLVLPHPKAGYAYEHALQQTNKVMVLTDHLSNDHNIVNQGVKFTQKKGQLFLVHIEDQQTFERYLDAIAKIPSIETDNAQQELQQQLLKMPKDYIRSCRDILSASQVDIEVIKIVEFGHHLAQCRRYVEQEKIDLLVMRTKDDDQLAMHGLAYPLAIEIRQIPLLML